MGGEEYRVLSSSFVGRDVNLQARTGWNPEKVEAQSDFEVSEGHFVS